MLKIPRFADYLADFGVKKILRMGGSDDNRGIGPVNGPGNRYDVRMG